MDSSKVEVVARAHVFLSCPAPHKGEGEDLAAAAMAAAWRRAKGGEERENLLTRELLSPWQPSQHQLL